MRKIQEKLMRNSKTNDSGGGVLNIRFPNYKIGITTERIVRKILNTYGISLDINFKCSADRSTK